MNSRHQGFTQNLGLIGAICGSLIVSLPAIAQVRSPDPSSINTGDFERICSEYKNQNQNQGQMQNNRTPASSSSADVVRDRTAADTTNRANSTGRTASGNTGTTSRRSSTASGVTNPPGSADNPTGGNLGTAISRGSTTSANTGTTSDRANTAGTTNQATSSDSNVSGSNPTTTSDREGYGSYSAEELERLCADYTNNSDTNRNSPSGTQRQRNPQTSPNSPSNPNTSPSKQRRSSRIVPPTPEQQQAASARIRPVNGRIALRLVNETGANITYQIIGDSNERSLPGRSDVMLQTLLTPTTITFYRPDYGLLIARPQTTAQPGMLEVRFAPTTDLGMDKNALTIEPTGAVFLN